MDTVLLLILTLIGHSTVAYTTVWYIFKRKSNELAQFAKPEKLVPILMGVFRYREPAKEGEPDNPTVLEAFCAYLGTQLGRYIASMMGRASRDINNTALDAVAEQVPVVKALLEVPGMKKMLKNPIVAQFVGPAIQGIINKNVKQTEDNVA